jgi:peptidoglycan/LPS O-acetylase OafA/YrhL
LAFRFNPAIKDVPSIGLMRGVASVMVCYFHLAHENPRLLPNESIIKQSATWGWAGVEVFFIISGFVIPYSMYVNNYTVSKALVFLKKRIIRIEPPYLISIVLVLLLNFISTLLPTYKGAPFVINWPNVASHIAYLNIFTGEKWLQDVYWTLAIEFQYYLLISIAYYLVVSPKLYCRLVFYAAFISLMFFKLPGNGFIVGLTAYFMLGILLFQYYCRIIGREEFWVLFLINLAALYYFQDTILMLISAVTVGMIAFIKKVPSFFSFLGLISFSLYLIHIPVGGRINNLASNYISNIHLREAVVFVSMACCLFAAWLFYLIVEKKFKKLSALVPYRK